MEFGYLEIIGIGLFVNIVMSGIILFYIEEYILTNEIDRENFVKYVSESDDFGRMFFLPFSRILTLFLAFNFKPRKEFLLPDIYKFLKKYM